MKPRIIILLSLLLILDQAFSQDLIFEWNKILGTSGFNFGKSIISDQKEYLYAAGEFKEEFIYDDQTIVGPEENNIYILKLDFDGNLIWYKSIGSNKLASIGNICFDRDMNIVCTGTFENTLLLEDTIFSSNGGSDLFILRYNNNGKLVNIYTDGGEEDEVANSLCVDYNNDLYICGSFSGKTKLGEYEMNSPRYVINTDGQDTLYGYINNAFYAKFDSLNNCLLTKHICLDQSNLNCISNDKQNNIYTTGNFYNQAELLDTITSDIGDFLVFKYDQNGKLLNLIQEGSDNDYIVGKSIVLDQDNNLFVAGYIKCVDCIFGDSLLPNSYTDGFLVKYNTTGKFEWVNLIGQYEYHGEGNSVWANSVVIDYSNNILVTGYFDAININEDILFGNSNSIDIFILKASQNGEIINLGRYGDPSWGTSWDEGKSLAIDSNNNIYITGITSLGARYSFDPHYIFTGKINSDFPLNNENIKIQNEINIYPNPASDYFTIDFPSCSHKNIIVEIFRLDGMHIYSSKLNIEQNKISVSGLPPDLYVVRFKIEDKIYYKKLLIR